MIVLLYGMLSLSLFRPLCPLKHTRHARAARTRTHLVVLCAVCRVACVHTLCSRGTTQPWENDKTNGHAAPWVEGDIEYWSTIKNEASARNIKVSRNCGYAGFLACLRMASTAILLASARDTACLAMTAETVSTSAPPKKRGQNTAQFSGVWYTETNDSRTQ